MTGKHKTSVDYHALAAQRGFEWLGPMVKNADTKTGWRCSKGHEWQTAFHNISNGSGCPRCARKERVKPDNDCGVETEHGFEWPGMKFCHKCQTWHPATPEFFARNKARYDGLAVWCKSCMNLYSKQLYSDPNFAQRHSEYGKNYHKDKMTNDPDYAERRRRNKRKRDAKRRQDPLKVKADREYQRQQRLNRQMKGLPPPPSQAADYKRRKWHERRDNDPAFVEQERIRVQKRITRRLALPNNFTAQDWMNALDYWGGACAICGQQNGLFHTVVADHWIPLSDKRPDNPGTVATNIIPLCHVRKGAGTHGSCNQSKGRKDPVEWLVERLGKRAAKKKLAEIETYFTWVQENSEGE